MACDYLYTLEDTVGEDNEKLRDVIITRQVVQKEIENLKKNKLPGSDKIYPWILKECKEIFSGPLTNVFRKSIDFLPSLWKEANEDDKTIVKTSVDIR